MANPADAAIPAPRRGWSDKRDAILEAGLRVFGRDGFSRGSIDAIASEASVSSRTIYNHFGDKESLFRAVIDRSATHVADAQVAVITNHLDNVQDAAADLTAFALAWSKPSPDFAAHFALVRQVNAEVAHIPAPALKSWQEAGPLRVRRELSLRLRHLADRGILHAPDADLAASHLIALTANEVATRNHPAGDPLNDDEILRLVSAGINAFLHGYAPSHSGPHAPAVSQNA